MATYKFLVELTDATSNIELESEPNSSYPTYYMSVNSYNMNESVHIEITAKDGYYFPTPPTLLEFDTERTYEFISDDSGEHKSHYYLDYIFEGEEEVPWWSYPFVSGLAQVIPKADKYGIVTMYNPTTAELKEIGNVRYYNGSDGIVDLGNFISSLNKVFVKIPKGDRANVLLGGYNTEVSANVILDDVVETNCGTVDIIGKYGNSMDYENTTVEIYLPLIGFQQLDTDKVMNETLSLIYRTNVINGDTIACIYNTTGTLIYTFNCKASFEIPYRVNDESEPRGNVGVNANYLFGFTPIVTIRYNKAYNASSTIASDNQETTLDTLTGYVKCSEVFNTINATTTEKEEIDDLLKTGVIIT